ncbi:MAG: hypothetical protein IBJ11_10990 [Phycisphaerales bacterium]|nr:hypothetical protein [Phycisphaerales bacterium]
MEARCVLFTGEYEHTIDAKGRLAIPADIRGQWDPAKDGGVWFSLPWIQKGERLVRLYTETGFGRLAAARQASLDLEDDEAELQTALFAYANRLEPDSAGRIRISDRTLRLINLPAEVMIVGAGDHLQVRDRAAWLARDAERFASLPDLVARLRSRRHRPSHGGDE